MKIIWIDDKVAEMQNVIHYIFKSLWQKDIRSEIYIIGETLPSNTTGNIRINTLNEMIVDVFVDYLIDENLINDASKSKELYKLIHESIEESKDKVKLDVFTPTSNVVADKSKIFEKIWGNIQKNIQLNSDNTLSNPNDTQLLLNDILDDNILKNLFGNHDKKIILMIDMCLCPDDFSKLVNDTSPCIFSSYLCHLFRQKKGCDVFMYTSYLQPHDLIKHWKKGYEEEFPGDKEVEFFGRDGANLNGSNSNLCDILIKIKDKEQSNDQKDVK